MSDATLPRRHLHPGYLRGRPAAEWADALAPRSTARGRRRRPARTPVAVVTGGGRGLGRVVAEALAAAGMGVGLVARSPDELAAVGEAISGSGGVVTSVTADVRDERAGARAVEQVVYELGPIDLLINNAGIGGPIGPAWEVDLARWWETIDVNLGGTLVWTRLVLPQMVARRRGRIVNVTSHAGVFRWPTVSAYSVSKAAVVKLTENLAFESRQYGVTVFGVHPGLLPVGLSESHAARPSEGDPYQRRVDAWVRAERAGTGSGSVAGCGAHRSARLWPLRRTVGPAAIRRRRHRRHHRADRRGPLAGAVSPRAPDTRRRGHGMTHRQR